MHAGQAAQGTHLPFKEQGQGAVTLYTAARAESVKPEKKGGAEDGGGTRVGGAHVYYYSLQVRVDPAWGIVAYSRAYSH